MNKLSGYNEIYDTLGYSAEQKMKIAQRSAATASTIQRKKQRKTHPLLRVAATAACLISVMTVSAEAAGISTPVSEILSPIFGGNVAQTEVINKIGHPIDASDTDNGITISADAIIGDEYNTCILFTIRRDDGTTLLPEGISEKSLLIGGSSDISIVKNGGGHGSSRFVDTLPGDNEIQYLYNFSSDQPINKNTCIVTFKDFQYWNPDTESPETIIKGKWKFRFEMDYEDNSYVLGNGETFRQGGMNFTITQIRISPIAVQVSYEVDSEVQWSNAPSGRLPAEDRLQIERYMENIQIILAKKDGSIINLCYSGGSVRPENGRTYCTKGDILDEIVPLEEMNSIQVGTIFFSIDP